MDKNLQKFDQFKLSSEGEIQRAMAETKDQLSDEPTKLVEQLNRTERWYTRLMVLQAEADFFYQLAKAEFLPPKAEKTTELDRETIQDALTAKYKARRDKIENLCKSFSVRISLGQSELAYLRQFREANLQ